jgi:DNA-binding MarR family transcriptional regulator
MSRESADAVRRDLFLYVLGMMGNAKNHVLGLAAEDGLSESQLHALLLLTVPCSQRQLAEKMGIDASSVVDIADRLEQLGLVQRTIDPRDRRIRLLVLADDGEKLRRKVFERALAESPLNQLNPAEHRQLRDLLAKMVDPVDLQL